MTTHLVISNSYPQKIHHYILFSYIPTQGSPIYYKILKEQEVHVPYSLLNNKEEHLSPKHLCYKQQDYFPCNITVSTASSWSFKVSSERSEDRSCLEYICVFHEEMPKLKSFGIRLGKRSAIRWLTFQAGREVKFEETGFQAPPDITWQACLYTGCWGFTKFGLHIRYPNDEWCTCTSKIILVSVRLEKYVSSDRDSRRRCCQPA